MCPIYESCDAWGAKGGRATDLSAASEGAIDLAELLTKPLLALLRHWVLITVTSVVTAERIDGGVQRIKRSRAGNFVVTTIKRHKIVHF